MKYFIIAIFIFSQIGLILGQGKSSVSGKVLNSDKEPLIYASLVLFNAADSSIVKTSFSDGQGKFILDGLRVGKYWLRAQFTGLKSYNSSQFSLDIEENKTLNPITLNPASADEVQITAQKQLIEVKPDMTVLNVEGTAIAIGESAFELLRKAPGVILDNNDNVLLMGKSGVRIYIDGKPSPLSAADLAEMLKGIQSDQIEAIEIISNPGAKYEAEGNAGIINIRLKKDKSLGTQGNGTLGYAIGRYGKYNGSVSFNSRSKKTNLFGSYSGGTGRTYYFSRFLRRQNEQVFDQDNNSIIDTENHNFKLGMDFFLSPKSTLGFIFNGFISDRDDNSVNITPISDEITGTPLQTLDARNINLNSNNSFTGNLNYVLQGENDFKLSLDVDWGSYRLRRSSFQPNYYLNPARTDTLFELAFDINTPTDIDLYSVKGDIERKLGKGNLTAGFKSAFINTNNTFEFSDIIDGREILNNERSNKFYYRENISAVYANYQQKVNKWTLSLGLRTEYTHTRGELVSDQETGMDTVKRDYINLFPTAGITYQMNQNHSLRLNYSRRIDRPRYQDLNPFVYQSNQLSFSQGNPFLRPQFTHSLQLTHTFKYRYSTSISYSLTNDYFTQLTDTFNQEASFITQENLATREVISANMSIPHSLTKWWSTYTNLNLSRNRNRGDFNLPGEEGKDIDITRTTFNIYQQHTFTLSKIINVEVSGFYSSPSIWGANYLSSEFWGINTGATLKMLKNRASLRVALSDIFFSMQWQGIQRFGGLVFDASGGNESRQFKVSFTYRFGNEKVKASRKRKTGLQDETNRVGTSEN